MEGEALVQNNDLSGNEFAGIWVTNGAVADAGNCNGNNVTGWQLIPVAITFMLSHRLAHGRCQRECRWFANSTGPGQQLWGHWRQRHSFEYVQRVSALFSNVGNNALLRDSAMRFRGACTGNIRRLRRTGWLLLIKYGDTHIE